MFVDHLQVSGAAEALEWIGFIDEVAKEDDDIACVLEILGGDVLAFGDLADDCDGGSGIDRAVGVLVLEANVAASDGGFENAAGFGEAFD